MNVYLDNGSTSFPKPKQVLDNMYEYMLNVGGNANRSNHSNALDSNRILLSTRRNLCNFFNFNKIENVIFTNNVTTSLNYLLLGSIKEGDHVISSTMEHNSVLRPLFKLKEENKIELTLIEGNSQGFISKSQVKEAILHNTKFVVLSACSNVVGSIQPLFEIGKLCKEHNIFFIVDTAQAAGHYKVDMNECNISALAFTGHKGLFGPQGIGGFILTDELNEICHPTVIGGTGSLSHSLEQPTYLPDKFESGTLNMPGIVGLNSALNFLNEVGLSSIEEKISSLYSRLISALKEMPNFILYSGDIKEGYSSIISIRHKTLDASELSFLLEENGVKNRAGLHCAPLAHKTLGTYPDGTVRLSIGYFNTLEEIDYTIEILSKIDKGILY